MKGMFICKHNSEKGYQIGNEDDYLIYDNNKYYILNDVFYRKYKIKLLINNLLFQP